MNKVPQKQYVQAPTVQDIFNMSKEEIAKANALNITSSKLVTDKGSHFRGHAVRVQGTSEIRLAYKRMKMLFPESNHIMMAYVVKDYTGNCDDGEYGASKRLLQLVSGGGFSDTILFVTREYAGTHLGQRCFLHIEKVAKEALDVLHGTH